MNERPEPSEAEVGAVLPKFAGDARAAIRALLHDLAVLAADHALTVSRGYVRGGGWKSSKGRPAGVAIEERAMPESGARVEDARVNQNLPEPSVLAAALSRSSLAALHPSLHCGETA